MKKRLLVSFLCILVLCSCCITAYADEGITSLEQLGDPGRIIAVPENMIEFDWLKRDYPEAEVRPINDYALGLDEVAKGRIDAYIYTRPEMELAIQDGVTGIRLLDENYNVNEVAIGLSPKSKIPDLQKKINTFLSELREDGTLDDMYQRWFIDKNYTMPKIEAPKNPSLHLTVGTTGTVIPATFYSGTNLTGYDIELAYRFAAWLGADVQFKIYDFGGIVAAASAGDVDCIMSNLFATEEHRQKIPFSDPLLEIEITAAVRDTDSGTIPGLAEYADKRIGVFTGSTFPDLVTASFPDAEQVFFNSLPDLCAALDSDKIDAFAIDEPVGRSICAEFDNYELANGYFEQFDYAFGFAKNERGQALCDDFSGYIRELKEDGTLTELQHKWFDQSPDPYLMTYDPDSLPDTNGALTMTFTPYTPFEIQGSDGYYGYEADLFVMFCEKYGYRPKFLPVDFDGQIPAIQSGKADTCASGLSITEERKESILFSEPDYSGGATLLVKKPAPSSGNALFSGIKDSFEKTFIRENRWKLFLKGIHTTLLITVLSFLFGTLLGFAVYMLCRNGNRAANKITDFMIWLVDGMPVVVLLMILYYIIFGNVNITGTVVSIIAFTLVVTSAVYQMIASGVGAVDRGQLEAAYSLGYTNSRAFFRVIFPQALPHFMPAYKGEITALIKATAVVGYVAVQDLTKMGDIVRSRTYEAFFPLISVAIIYFVLAGVLTAIVNRIEISIDPRRRSHEEILKGVNVND